MPEELHELVKRFRGDLSQAEVAARMGKSDGAVAHWESGRTGMASEAVDDFADALGLTDTDRRRLHQAATARRRKAASTTAARLAALEQEVAALLGELDSQRALIEQLLDGSRSAQETA